MRIKQKNLDQQYGAKIEVEEKVSIIEPIEPAEEPETEEVNKDKDKADAEITSES